MSVCTPRRSRPDLSALNVYDFGKVPGTTIEGGPTVPGTTPPLYVMVSVERRHVPNQRNNAASPSRSGWRVGFACVGTTVNEARWLRLQVADEFDGQTLAVGGRTSTRWLLESSQAPEPERGHVTALSLYTYAL